MKQLIFPGIALFLVLMFSLLPTPETNEQTDTISSLSSNFVLTDLRIYDGDTLIENGLIVVRDNKVEYLGEMTESPTDVPSMSAEGMTLLPGLIDAHTHNWGDASKEALNFGVATELDMFTAPETARPHFNVRDSI